MSTVGGSRSRPPSSEDDSNGNILRFTPRHFQQPIAVQFPHLLPVCEKCKRNYKTKEHCRVKCGHTDLPWSTVFVCITVDGARLATGGKRIDVESLIIKEALPRPYLVKKAFEDPKTPCCASCKKSSRSRPFCREKMAHRTLPWNTVFVEISSADQEGDDGKTEESFDKERGKKDRSDRDGNDRSNRALLPCTLLCTVSIQQNVTQWLEQDSPANEKMPPLLNGGSGVTLMQQHKSNGRKGRKRRAKDELQKTADDVDIPKHEKKKIRDEARAAISSAKRQSKAEWDQFFHHGAQLQRMMKTQAHQMCSHRPHPGSQSQPTKERFSNAQGIGIDVEAKEADKLPLDENPEED